MADGMRVWLTSFILLFGAAELFQWAKSLTLPMPIFVLGGAFLAIASNYDKLRNLPIHLDYEPTEVAAPPDSPVVKDVTATMKKSTVRAVIVPDSQAADGTSKRIAPGSSATLPAMKPPARQPISFEIRRPFKPGD